MVLSRHNFFRRIREVKLTQIKLGPSFFRDWWNDVIQMIETTRLEAYQAMVMVFYMHSGSLWMEEWYLEDWNRCLLPSSFFQALKYDVVRSVLSRLEVLCDDIIDNLDDNTKNG